MSKHAVILIALATVLAGCAGSPHRAVPVVESGAPLSPGAMRDSRVRQSTGTTQPAQTSGVAVMPQGESKPMQRPAHPLVEQKFIMTILVANPRLLIRALHKRLCQLADRRA